MERTNIVSRDENGALQSIRIDNTKRSDFVQCPYKFSLRHLHGLQPRVGSTAIRFGGVWHKVLEGFFTVIKEEGWANRAKAIEKALTYGAAEWDVYCRKQDFYDDYRTLETLTELFFQYINHFADDSQFLEVIDTESKFEIDMKVTADEFTRFFLGSTVTPQVIFTGKIDRRVRLSGIPFIYEEKTSGQDVFIQSMRLDRLTQTIGYNYAANILFEDVQGILVAITHASARKGKDGTYGKIKMDFNRSPQIYSEGVLREWRASYLHTVGQIVMCTESGYFPRQFDHCYDYNSRCRYANLCVQNKENVEDLNDDGYIVDYWDVEAED